MICDQTFCACLENYSVGHCYSAAELNFWSLEHFHSLFPFCVSLFLYHFLLFFGPFSALSAYQRYFSLQLDYWKVSFHKCKICNIKYMFIELETAFRSATIASGHANCFLCVVCCGPNSRLHTLRPLQHTLSHSHNVTRTMTHSLFIKGPPNNILLFNNWMQILHSQ